MTHALVTGASGFIGNHLVESLLQRGHQVTALVRPSSDRSRLEPLGVRFAVGDVTDRDSMQRAMAGVDVVYHLAGVTKSLRSEQMTAANEAGVRNVALACAGLDRTPVMVLVSSLAAAGPARDGIPRDVTDPPRPVSNYGRSKRAGELAAIEMSSAVPTTIVRPPIVLGEGDRDGFAMFQSIATWGLHLVPSLRDRKMSVIHARDLAVALQLAAQQGRRVSPQTDDAAGIYFATAEHSPTYADLGRMIATAMGKRHVLVVRAPGPAVWTVAGFNEVISRVRRQPHILSLDKAREATAGAWHCTSDALHRDTGFMPARSLSERLQQTARWYVQQGWLKAPRAAGANRRTAAQQRDASIYKDVRIR